MTQITEALEAARAHILDSYRIWQADDVSAVPPPKSGAGSVIAKIDAILSSPGKDSGHEVEAAEWQGRYWIEDEGRWSNWITNPVGYRWAHEPQEGKSEIRYLYPQPTSTALVEISGITLRTDNTKSYGQDVVVFACMPDGKEVEVIRSFGALPEVTIHHHVTDTGIRSALSSTSREGER